MRQDWDPEDLLATWTLVEADRELVANEAGATRLGFALLLRASVPVSGEHGERPAAAVAFVAEQVGVRAGDLRAGATRE